MYNRIISRFSLIRAITAKHLHQKTCVRLFSEKNNSAVQDLLSSESFSAVLVRDDGYHRVKLTRWLKQEFEWVKENEELCEIETPDYFYSITAKFDGYLAKIIPPEGTKDLEPGDILCYLCEDKEDMNELRDVIDMDEEEHSDLADSDFDLKDWLEKVDPKYTKYVTVLEEAGYESVQELHTLTREDLEKLGVKSGHAKVILSKLNL